MHACSRQEKSKAAIRKAVSIHQAVKSATKALQENSPDDIQGYLALNDFILEQIRYSCTYVHEKKTVEASESDSDSPGEKLAKVC